MTRINMGAIRGRVERLASTAHADCGRGHLRITHDIDDGREPAMVQPEAGASERCRCGAAITSLRIIHELPEGAQACAV